MVAVKTDQLAGPENQNEIAGLIWITGYSGSGKTTVARKVAARLQQDGVRTIFLDGDELRSIFGSHWGYERAQRIELARVYFRLCSHLVSQGCTVVISAVAMYHEVSAWIKTNIPRSLQVYLNVPEEERRRRDEASKKIYKNIDFSAIYDDPREFDIAIDNFGSSTPSEVAEYTIKKYLNIRVNRDMGRRSHWSEYYSSATAPAEPSSFAKFVAQKLGSGGALLEIGCGNGRDASFFARNGQSVTAIDLSESAIERCRVDHVNLDMKFLAGTINDLAEQLICSFEAIYSRFVLHAMPLAEESETLRAAFHHLRPGGLFFIECRSINDPMAREGEVISPTERINGHYRRFIVLEELEKRLELAGFQVIDSIESAGLAVFGDQDPVIIRIMAQKPK